MEQQLELELAAEWRVSEFDAHDLCNTVWAVAKAGQLDESLPMVIAIASRIVLPARKCMHRVGIREGIRCAPCGVGAGGGAAPERLQRVGARLRACTGVGCGRDFGVGPAFAIHG